MTSKQLQEKLTELLEQRSESEWVEFKHNRVDPEEIGQYISALSNSATLHHQTHGFMVWGIEDGTFNVLGTTFKPRKEKAVKNEDLEPWLAHGLSPKIDFCIYEFSYQERPVVLFQIQAAKHHPVAFRGQDWIRVGSHKKPLKNHPEKERELWRLLSAPGEDWTAQICESAKITDLDPDALKFARNEYKRKHPKLAQEVDKWDEMTFLNKAKICVDGRVTRAAILLLGKNESEHYLSPGVARISWILRNERGVEVDYEHFGPPFLLMVEQVFAKVRNLTHRYMLETTLFPTEVTQYDPWVIRETLHNCIAHQDYSLCGKINLVELPESLLFVNVGQFLPGSVEEAIARDAPPQVYPNRFLAEAMVSLNMIDTIGSGIKRMFMKQRDRNFPMPDYDLSESNRVKVRIIGKVIDERYTRLLMERTDLDLWEVIALDKVQKKKAISADKMKSLKRKKLVEGRSPNLYVSASVAKVTETMVDHLKKRGIDKAYCQKMVIELLKKQGQAGRRDFNNLLVKKLSDVLSEEQKMDFVANLLQEMRRNGVIQPVEGKRGKGTMWELCKSDARDLD